MNKREKVLASLVGVMLIGMGLLYFGAIYMGELNKLNQDIKAKTKAVADQSSDFTLGTRATEYLTELEAKALPWDVEDAQRLYQAWLLDTLDKQVGFASPDVATGVPRIEKDPTDKTRSVYMTHQFTVTCKGDVGKLTRFLYHFYSADLLHYFDDISIRQLRDGRDLSLTFNIRAMALPNAPAREELKPAQADLLVFDDVDPYIQSIAYRNPFGFKNNQPKLSVSSSVSVTQGESLSLTPTATDPDKGDEITFDADLEELPGAKIDERTGKLSWRPKELGEHRLTVYATDNGFPPKVSAADVVVNVVEPEKPMEVVEERGFDNAKLAIVSAIVRTRGQPQVWLALRSEGKLLKLKEGDPFEVGYTDATVLSIEQRQFKFKTKEGELKVVELGQNIADAQVVSSGE